MDKRIERITKQVDEYFDDLSIEFSREAWMEKFAELIVRECIDQCAYTPNSNDEWDKGVKWAAKQIAEHFGVK